MNRRSHRGAQLVAALGMVTALAACAHIPEAAAPRHWHNQPSLQPENPPSVEVPGLGKALPRSPQAAPSSVPPPQGCKDFNPAVIATCLNPVSAVVALPGSDAEPSGLAAERGTGRVLQVSKDTDPVMIERLTVNTAGGGGLTGLALSPSYTEDQLIYAYITTPTDNRIVRFSAHGKPQAVLTGIPRGHSDNAGAIATDPSGALLVATGDAGNTAAAANPTSLAGKVLRIDGNGKPAPGDPTSGSAVIASGLHAPGGLCSTTDGKTSYVTDAGTGAQRLYRIRPGAPVRDPVWEWKDNPGIAGCAVFPHLVMVAASRTGGVRSVFLNPDGSVKG
ncbi:MAG: PQQ-dependent sugar dehydrogenase, partial [Sciscionella sp.]